MAGLEALTGVGGIGAIGGAGGASGIGGVGGLAQAWQTQMLSGSTGAGATSGVEGGLGVTGIGGVTGADSASGLDFGAVLGRSLESLEATDKVAQSKAVDAATGDLNDIHDYVIAANEAQVATELTTTIRNKALDAFNEIMRMPL
ncbi:MAG: flagellar hook-basal body complex protein FliE [Kineosporiaceae bacterium]